MDDPVTIKAAVGLSAATRAAMYEIYYPPLIRCPSCHANTSLDNGTSINIRFKEQGRTKIPDTASYASINDGRKKSILAYLEASYWHPEWVLDM